MLAWLGGRRRLVKEQKARKRLEGVVKRTLLPPLFDDKDAPASLLQKFASPKREKQQTISYDASTSLDLLALSAPSSDKKVKIIMPSTKQQQQNDSTSGKTEEEEEELDTDRADQILESTMDKQLSKNM